MKIKLIKSSIVVALIAIVFTGCVNDRHYEVPDQGITTYQMVSNVTVASVNSAASATPVLYAATTDADKIIEAYVTSSDESGNFYNSISFQTIPTDNSAPIGFSVSVSLKSYMFGFTPGRKVYIKLNGLYTAIANGSLTIGALYNGSIGRIATSDWQKYLFPSAEVVSEDSFVRPMSLAAAAADANINTLVEITNVQFADGSLNRTYYDVDSGGGATNHNIVDVNGTTPKYFRVSSYALFCHDNVPSGRGSIRGVMTKYGTDYQFYVRDESDVKLNSPRTYNYSGTVSENFESFAASQIIFTNYMNFYTQGTKNWQVKSSGGKFLEMSAYGGNIEDNKSYFIIPVDFTAANNLMFQIRAGYYTGGLGLKVYRTTDFVPGSNLSDATLYDITTSFANLPTASTTTFASAGTYAIPASVTGNGYFVFEYSGSNRTAGPPLTTNCDLDNIVIN
jgi:hypothetical protein